MKGYMFIPLLFLSTNTLIIYLTNGAAYVVMLFCLSVHWFFIHLCMLKASLLNGIDDIEKHEAVFV